MNRLLLFIFLVTGSYYGYIGFEYTWYRFGLYFFVPGIIILSAIIAFLVNLKQRSQWYWWKWFTGLSSTTFLILIVAHHIEAYKPTVKLYIPETYEGTVTLLPGKVKQSSYNLNQEGIIYWRAEEEVNIKIYHGDHNISDVLNVTGHHYLYYYNNDSTIMDQVNVQCFEVAKDRNYPDNSWNQVYPKCIDKVELERLIKAGIVDESQLCKTRYKKKNASFYPVKGQCF